MICWCYGEGRVGWDGGAKNVQLYFHTHVMLRYCRFFLLPHTRHATLLQVPLALAHTHTHVMLRYCRFFLHFHTHTSFYATAGSSCTCTHTHTHTSCYATAGSSCTCAHASCYATTAGSSCTCTHTHTRHATLLQVLLALAHTRHATLLQVPLALARTHTHTSCYATAGSSCTCTHTSCYATAGSSCTCTQSSRNVGVGWGGGANNVQVYFHTHVMLRYCTFLACGNTYASSSTDITRRTRPPRCSG